MSRECLMYKNGIIRKDLKKSNITIAMEKN